MADWLASSDSVQSAGVLGYVFSLVARVEFSAV